MLGYLRTIVCVCVCNATPLSFIADLTIYIYIYRNDNIINADADARVVLWPGKVARRRYGCCEEIIHIYIYMLGVCVSVLSARHAGPRRWRILLPTSLTYKPCRTPCNCCKCFCVCVCARVSYRKNRPRSLLRRRSV